MGGAVNILRFSDPLDAPFIGLEYAGGEAIMDDPTDVAKFQVVFASLVEIALSPHDTADLLRAVRRELGDR
ncbi:Scr1 family TA system antitoxin-like transcriptional regulator [Saccharothrix sp. ALI-22-I]|uniref:Scr1 family TA system antitoxin-like transcriptional regulator n=1 Tax=Saccharothrix sp. ALI-22-I TaxID=1933778 RepID=UPI002378C48E|nr:Scr1 family TA system antitoxin-like transcriptional regulator [Saccharothrix sp. ALI-22-I]